MEIRHQPSETVTGPADWFTGIAYMTNFKQPADSNRLAIGSVTFSPGARTFWHSHPHGQTLIVTEGLGLVGRRNAPPQEVGSGDVVIIEPGEEHWHGACQSSLMSHIHINEVAEDGTYATFLDPVSEDDYRA